MSSKIDFCVLRTNKYPFLRLRTSKTLSLGEFDESKTHLFLGPFFEYISGLKVQFNTKFRVYFTQIFVLHKLKENELNST